jgi:hypothetical protein
METNQQNKQATDLEQLVRGLQHEDNRNLRLTNTSMWSMGIMAPLYFVLFIIRVIDEPFSLDQLGFLFFSFAFLSFALLFRSLHKEYKSIDYGVSTVEMLTKAVARYCFWQSKIYKSIFPAIIACLAISLSCEHLIPHPDQTTRLLIVFFGYLAILCCSFFVGYLIWRKRQKPLRDKALALLAEIEN